ncbi:MAG TPA: AmmeMemoRadiSam system protein A [Acidobacteriota bacterium]|nr:AmmeMemoRadiSam system protein A [Acidobacteriota bacterium]
MFDSAERASILRLARQAIVLYLETRREMEAPDTPPFSIVSGAFVTLKRDDELRGCIGYTETREALGATIVRCAIAAATRDARFPQVRLEEMEKMRIEVSVLSPRFVVSDVSQIEVGVHGLFLTYGPYRGLLLPQVPVEHQWDRETFLRQTSRKAGLPPDGWTLPGVQIDAFTAEVFGED